jgi:hypothetical protein
MAIVQHVETLRATPPQRKPVVARVAELRDAAHAPKNQESSTKIFQLWCKGLHDL